MTDEVRCRRSWRDGRVLVESKLSMLCLLRGLSYSSDCPRRHRICADLVHLALRHCLSLGRPCLCEAFAGVPPRLLRWGLLSLYPFLAATLWPNLWYYRETVEWQVLSLWRLEGCFRRVGRRGSRQTLPEVACTNIGGAVGNGTSRIQGSSGYETWRTQSSWSQSLVTTRAIGYGLKNRTVTGRCYEGLA